MWHLIVSIPDLCTLTYFDPTKKKNSGSSNIELRISNWFFDIHNRALKVSFDIKNLIFVDFPNAKERV